MNILSKIITEQWVFMVIAVVGVTLTFLMKKIVPKSYTVFLKGALIVFSAALLLLAFRGYPDLFLLVPIIIICCELFGYDVTGKIVGILFVDFLLIQVDFKLISQVNETLMNVIFFLLQILVAVCIGIVMDKYLKENAQEKKKLQQEESTKEEEKSDTDTITNDNDDE